MLIHCILPKIISTSNKFYIPFFEKVLKFSANFTPHNILVVSQPSMEIFPTMFEGPIHPIFFIFLSFSFLSRPHFLKKEKIYITFILHRNTYFSDMCNRGFEHLGFDNYLYFLSCSDWCPLVPRGWIRDGVPRAVPGAGSTSDCHRLQVS